jgi:hypothetical protein
MLSQYWDKIIHVLAKKTIDKEVESASRQATLKEQSRWKKLILNDEELEFEIKVAKAENKLKSSLEKAFLYGNGTTKTTSSQINPS